MNEVFRLEMLGMQTLSEVSCRRSIWNRRSGRTVKRGSYAQRLLQAGIFLPVVVWLGGVMLSGLIFITAAHSFCGMLGASALGGLFVYHACFNFPDSWAEKRRRLAVAQLPSFVDALQASISAGYSVEAALAQAHEALPPGILKEELTAVIQALHARTSPAVAVEQLTHNIRGQEIVAVVLTFRLFAESGKVFGEALSRLGARMREQRAVQEKVVRDLAGFGQAVAVMFAVTLTAPIVAYAAEPALFVSTFSEPTSRVVVQAVIFVQLLCLTYLKTLLGVKV